MEAKDRNCIQREILRKYPGTIPEIDIDWDIVEISFKAGIREEQKRMTKALRELHKQGWTLSDVIEAEDTCGEDCQTGGVKE